MIATYAPRVAVHRYRYGSPRPLPPSWVVIHTTEGGEGDDAAESLASFLTRPGDRTSADGSRYGSSYHAVADTGLRVIPAVEDHLVAFSAPGANTQGLHIVIPGRAGQTRAEWLAGASRGAITTVAAYLLDVRERYGITTERLTVAELRAGTRGYCDHAAISAAFQRTDHWDVGPDFPWDVLRDDLRALSPPLQTGDLMLYIAVPKFPGADANTAWLAVFESGQIRRAMNTDVGFARSTGVPFLDLDSAEQHADAVRKWSI